MNSRQKRVMVGGILVIVALFAVPTWIASFPAVQVTTKLTVPAENRAIGYAPFWNPPRPRFTDLPVTQNVYDLLYQPAKAREQLESDQRERASRAATRASEFSDAEFFKEALEAHKVSWMAYEQAEKQGLVKNYDEWWLIHQSPYADKLAQHVPLEVTLDIARLLVSIAITALLSGALFVVYAKTKSI